MITIRRALPAALALAAVGALSSGGSTAAADQGRHDDDRSFSVRLDGYQETPLALSTTGNGILRLRIDPDAGEIKFMLAYADLEGTVTQAHIHFGATRQSGGISAFLCSNLGNGPAGTAACPAAPGTVSGTLDAADVIGPVPQGITAGQLDELLAAISADATYVNVHSTLYPAGEIRSQLEGDDHDHDHDDHDD